MCVYIHICTYTLGSDPGPGPGPWGGLRAWGPKVYLCTFVYVRVRVCVCAKSYPNHGFVWKIVCTTLNFQWWCCSLG